MKYGLLKYDNSRFNLLNIGDYVQSIAARQFLPHIDSYIERDLLNQYDGEPIKVIMNGWFTHKPENWPPADAIIPHMVSFHLNKTVAARMMSDEKVVAYFRKHQPIGCRDHDSMRRMQDAGIEAYYSGCLTTTLNYNGKLFDSPPIKDDSILMVDVLFKDDIRFRAQRHKLLLLKDVFTGKLAKYNEVKKYIDSLVPKAYSDQVRHLTCYYDSNTTLEERFAQAEDILRQLAGARLVITSRIHIALPCLALGTPVLFAFGGKLSDPQEFRRLDGIINHMNVLVRPGVDTSADHLRGIHFFHPEDIDWANPPENPQTHLSIRRNLAESCQNFV